jgi:hypothetical protein
MENVETLCTVYNCYWSYFLKIFFI